MAYIIEMPYTNKEDAKANREKNKDKLKAYREKNKVKRKLLYETWYK